jgi:hypothetical protein
VRRSGRECTHARPSQKGKFMLYVFLLDPLHKSGAAGAG